MIRTNLLKTRVTKTQNQTKSESEQFEIPDISSLSSIGAPAGESVKAIISFFIIAIFPVALLIYEKFNLKVLNEENAKLRGELMSLTTEVDQKKLEADRVETVKKRIIAIDQKTKELMDLTKGRLVKIKGLDFLQNIIPERVWLTTVESKSKKIIFSGFSVTDDDLSEFLKKLENASFYKDVVIQKSQEAKTKDGLVKFFEITAQEGSDE